MKIKFLAIYIVVGAAFLIASLWVTLSGGKSAKAIRCKYKLGGIVLTAWAMLSVASCQGDLNPKMITCYDPAPPEMVYYLKDNEEVTDVKSGDVLVVKCRLNVEYAYSVKIIAQNTEKTLLQSVSFTKADAVSDSDYSLYEMTVGDFDYKGPATIGLYLVTTDENGKTEEGLISDSYTINIL
jgi:hypothetical protein